MCQSYKEKTTFLCLGKKIKQELKFDPPIYAFDQDLAIDAPIRYDIIAGNDRRFFSIDPQNGTLFLEEELDLDKEKNLPGNTFVLQVQASQTDNPLKTGVARVEIELIDLNDNLPEFEVDLYNISIVENLPNAFSVLQVIATDKDQGDNGEFSYQLEDYSGAFIMDPRSGWLTVRDQTVLDRERHSTISMKVYAIEKEPSIVIDSADNASVTVEVTLLDANDNNPMFVPSNMYEFVVESDSPIGTVVGKVRAVDPDLGRNGMVLYSFQRQTNGTFTPTVLPFTVDAQNGQILVIDSPLAEGKHALFVEASDQPSNPSERRFSLAVVTIEVIRAGMRDFIGAPYEFWVGDNVGIGTSVGQIRVTDAVSKHDVIYDMLHSYHDGVPFAVEERTGTIAVVDDISKYEQILYDFEAVVTDGRDITLVTNVTIHVVQLDDENSESMKSYGAPLEFRVRENLSGAFVGQIMNHTIYNSSRNSTDLNKLKSMRFIIANQQDVMDKFAVSQDGTIYTQKGLDREDRDIYILTVITENTRGIMRGAGIYQVNVVVEYENDNPPVFERQFYEGRIQENSRNGTEVKLEHLVKASDADIGPNAMFTFTLHGEGSEMFFVDQPSGKVYLKNGRLDREEKAIYFLRIVARDKGNLNSEAKLTIHVDDINDNAPTFLQMVLLLDEGVEIYEPGSETNFTQVNYLSTTNFTEHDDTAPLVTTPENTPVGTAILRLLSGDRDAGANSSVSYDIASETHITNKLLGPGFQISALKNYFSINSESGTITILRTLPPETEFRLNITATDGGGLMDNVSLRIYVKDVNDHAPVFKKTWYNFDLEEGYYSGHVLGRIEASDDDHGENGNVTYGIVQRADELPFEISETDGTLRVFGTIDRESRDSYSFQAIAQDSGPLHHRRRSLVDVEVHILDVNDNSPKFYNYDHILQTSRKAIDPKVEASATSESPLLVPIYYASVLENSPPGTLISRVFANDSDFLGNGNGLLLFDIPRRLNKETVTKSFSIDSKDGLIRTAGKIDYETQSAHNITVVASDLGNPSLSSTAVVAVNVIDVQEEIGEMSSKPMFSHRYYEVEVEENTVVPVPILDLEVSEYYKGMNLRYSLERTPGSDAFQIQPRNGTLFLVKSPDREMMEKYELKVRVDNVKRGRGLPIQLYLVPGDKLADLASNEVRVIVRVKDVNDNAPQFIGNGRPIIAAIPTSANYGYQIIKAVDADIGLNAEIRYQILGKVDDESRKFTIDPLTGQVRSIVSFARDAGRVYGFDVKATDRRGSDDGKSAITNVFVYVLDDQKQLIMVMGSKPTVIEKDMENITSILYNVTGVDVRVRKIEPHPDTDMENGVATNMFLYAVDPLMNVIIDMDTLQNLLSSKKVDIEKNLEGYHMLDISNGVPVSGKPANQRYLFSSLEVAVVVMGCIVFIGALTAAICIGCVRRSRYRRKQEKMSEIAKPFHSQLGFAISNPTNAIMNSQTKLFPSSYMETIQCGGDTTDTYVDMHSNKSDYHHHHHRHHHKHHANCTRHRDRRRTAARLSRTAENSMTSLHSSSKDSGIADRCICGHSTSPSSGDSSNGSYEDSLKSLHGHQSSSGNGTMVRKSHVTASSRRRQRQSDSPSRLRATPQPPQAAVLVSTLVRSPSDRRLTCPLTVSNDNTRF